MRLLGGVVLFVVLGSIQGHADEPMSTDARDYKKVGIEKKARVAESFRNEIRPNKWSIRPYGTELDIDSRKVLDGGSNKHVLVATVGLQVSFHPEERQMMGLYFEYFDFEIGTQYQDVPGIVSLRGYILGLSVAYSLVKSTFWRMNLDLDVGCSVATQGQASFSGLNIVYRNVYRPVFDLRLDTFYYLSHQWALLLGLGGRVFDGAKIKTKSYDGDGTFIEDGSVNMILAGFSGRFGIQFEF